MKMTGVAGSTEATRCRSATEFRAEAGDERDAAGELPVDHVVQQILRAPVRVAPGKLLRMRQDRVDEVGRIERAGVGLKQRHRAPP